MAEKKKFNISKQSLVFFCFFVASLAFMLWKCPFGFGGSDEAFYLTVPHRLCLGDELFFDEWHLSQLSSFFTLPFVWLYRLINGSNDGIILAARVVYVIIHSAAALVLYFRLKKYGIAAIPAAIIFMLFTPFDMMCYSYNTIAVDTLVLAGAFAGTAGENTRISHVIGGALFACAVVCCPYLAVAYVLYFACVLICTLLKKNGRLKGESGVFAWRSFGLFSCGILIIFVLFIIFFFRHSGIRQLISALPGLFTDPEHPGYSLWFMLKHYVYCLLTAHKLMPVLLVAFAVLIIAAAVDKNRSSRAALYFVPTVLCTLACWALFLNGLSENYYNAIMFPLVPLGLLAYILLEKKLRALFWTGYVLGVLYSFCVSASSNMGFLVLSMALAVADVPSVIFIGLLARQLRAADRKKAAPVCISALVSVLCLLALVVTVKATHCFWNGSPAALESRIDKGPARGIITSAELCTDYGRIYDDMQYYKDLPRGGMLVYAQETWCWLILDDYPYSSFSAWLSGLDETTEQRLALYYEINPEKYPHYIYILKDTAFALSNIDAEQVYENAEKYGFSVLENELSYKLEKIQ